MILPLTYRSTGGGISPTPSVPDGKTVTPINSVPIWIACAGIVGCSYTTLGEVLTDVGILEELINNHNAMDYLVRCKYFAGCGLVPKMTSNTTPYGEVIADYWPGTAHFPYYAFDDASTAWVSAQNAYSRLTYKFVDQVCVKKFTASIRTTKDKLGISGSIQGSNDGTTWTTLYTFSSSAETSKGIGINNSNNYLYYSLLPSSYNYNDGSVFGVRIDDLQFYTETYPLVDSERAMYFIGQNNYASDTLLADTDWLDAICNSQYMEYILNTKVPTMTDYTVPYGTVIESGHYNAYYGWHPFMSGAKDRTTHSETTAWYHSGKWIGYNFGKDVKIYKIETRYGHGGGNATDTVTYGADYSVDGTTWEEIPSVSFTATTTSTNVSSLLTNITKIECQAIRLRQNSTSYTGAMTYLQFYGRTDISDPSPEPSGYKALVPTMTSNTTPSGVASSSGGSYNNTAYKAFDADNVTYGVALAGNTTDQGNWLMYKFTKPVCVKEFILTDKIGTHTMNTVAMQLQGSNDGTNFYEVYSNSSYMASDDFDTKISIDNDNYYLYYRVYYSGGVQIVSGQYFSYILKLQLYGYEHESGNALIPTMSSDTTPVGECISSGVYLTYPNYYAFDETTTTFWHSPEGSESDLPWLGYHFTSPVKVKHIYFMNRSSGAAGAVHLPKTPILQGSNDGNAWYTIQQLTMTNFDIGGVNEFDIINNNEYYTYYRLLGSITSANQYYFCCSKLQLYGFRE